MHGSDPCLSRSIVGVGSSLTVFGIVGSNQLRSYDLVLGELKFTMAGHTSGVVCVSMNEMFAVSGSLDRSVMSILFRWSFIGVISSVTQFLLSCVVF